MTTYEKLRTRICELKSDILELKFGTKVIVNNDKWRNIEGDFIAFDKDEYKLRVGIGGYCVIESFKKDEIEIIGRDITLDDIIIALNVCNKLGLNIDFVSSSNVMSVVYSYKYNKGFMWQLGKPLHQQSEQTQLAILELIK